MRRDAVVFGSGLIDLYAGLKTDEGGAAAIVLAECLIHGVRHVTNDKWGK